MGKKLDLTKEQERLKLLEEKAQKKAKGFFTEFKKFATKGNVIDMAIGVIIGTAFTKIVNSLVNDIITPSLSVLTGKIDFSNLFMSLDGVKYPNIEAATTAGATVINFGQFLTNVVDFLMVALSLFIFFKILFKARRKEETKPITTKNCPSCLSEIPLEATRCAHCTSELNK